jgi:hypothetical protein
MNCIQNLLFKLNIIIVFNDILCWLKSHFFKYLIFKKKIKIKVINNKIYFDFRFLLYVLLIFKFKIL